jgi:hypothetical protein
MNRRRDTIRRMKILVLEFQETISMAGLLEIMKLKFKMMLQSMTPRVKETTARLKWLLMMLLPTKLLMMARLKWLLMMLHLTKLLMMEKVKLRWMNHQLMTVR